MNVQLAVFDLAGTTVKDDRFVHKVLQEAMRKHEVDISLSDANDVMGIPKPLAIQKLLEKNYGGNRIISDQWVEAIHQHFQKRMIDFYMNHSGVTEKDRVSETFEVLKSAGVKVYVDTGFDREIAEALIRRMGWLEKGLIDGYITSDEEISGRPYPDMIYKAMRLAGVESAKYVAKVGDTPSDLQQGAAAGCRWIIGVTTGAFTRLQLKFEPHTHLIENIDEVISIFSEQSEPQRLIGVD